MGAKAQQIQNLDLYTFWGGQAMFFSRTLTFMLGVPYHSILIISHLRCGPMTTNISFFMSLFNLATIKKTFGFVRGIFIRLLAHVQKINVLHCRCIIIITLSDTLFSCFVLIELCKTFNNNFGTSTWWLLFSSFSSIYVSHFYDFGACKWRSWS